MVSNTEGGSTFGLSGGKQINDTHQRCFRRGCNLGNRHQGITRAQHNLMNHLKQITIVKARISVRGGQTYKLLTMEATCSGDQYHTTLAQTYGLSGARDIWTVGDDLLRHCCDVLSSESLPPNSRCLVEDARYLGPLQREPPRRYGDDRSIEGACDWIKAIALVLGGKLVLVAFSIQDYIGLLIRTRRDNAWTVFFHLWPI
jgi:hypothetical protein